MADDALRIRPTPLKIKRNGRVHTQSVMHRSRAAAWRGDDCLGTGATNGG